MAGAKRKPAEWRALVNALTAEYERATGSALPSELAAQVAAVQLKQRGRPKGVGAAPKQIVAAMLREAGLSNRERAEVLNLQVRSVQRAAKKGANEALAPDLLLSNTEMDEVARRYTLAIERLGRGPASSDEFYDCSGGDA